MNPITVLMFGWEFPPHISGGLGTACYGLTKALNNERTKILFVVPKAYGDEPLAVINSSEVLLGKSQLTTTSSQEVILQTEPTMQIHVASRLIPYVEPSFYLETDEVTQWNYNFARSQTKEVSSSAGRKYLFSGTYGPALLDEVYKYSEVAREIARQHAFDVIHSHDWLTYLAGIEAKNESGKPLIVHVHATEYDRAGDGHIDDRIFEIEKKGMLLSDRVIAVSQWTKAIIISKYGIESEKIHVVHNGVVAKTDDKVSLLPKIADQVVTFLGRITWQKGPQYFVESAAKVLHQFPETHFIMAGSGDLLPKMIERVAEMKISDHFHFTGFLKAKQVHQVWNVSDVYVMPSVSEPFGITPLEAIRAGVPVIVSNQSGVGEVIDHAIKVDFWDTDSLADSIMNILRYNSLATTLRKNSKKELDSITWERAAKKINKLYHELKDNPAIH